MVTLLGGRICTKGTSWGCGMTEVVRVFCEGDEDLRSTTTTATTMERMAATMTAATTTTRPSIANCDDVGVEYNNNKGDVIDSNHGEDDGIGGDEDKSTISNQQR